MLDDSVYADWDGYRVRAPFLCLCCGDEVSHGQFEWARLCVRCEHGECYPKMWVDRRGWQMTDGEFAHPRFDATEYLNNQAWTPIPGGAEDWS